MEKPREFASICAILRRNRKNKYGEYPIIIRVTKNRKVAITVTEYAAHKFQWDNKNSLPNEKHPQYFEIVKFIEDAKVAMRMAMKQLALENPAFTPKDIIDRYRSNRSGYISRLNTKEEDKSISVREYYDRIMQRMEMKGQFSTKNTYVYAFMWLDRFKCMDTLKLKYINKAFLEDLLAFMIREKEREKDGPGVFGQSTLFGYFKNYKALMNKAIEDGMIGESESNFRKFKLSQFKLRKNPRPIPLEQFQKIIQLRLKPYSRIWNSRNYLVFSFLGNGINFTDLAMLEKRNIANGRVTYIRAKTGETCKFKLNDLTLGILDDYSDITFGSYLFPILKGDLSKKEKYDRIKTARGNLNRDLKTIQKLCGIDINLTFYTGRHSCASLMKTLGLTDDVIGESYGHKSQRSIKNYLKSLSTESSDTVSDRVFESLLASSIRSSD